MYCLIFGILRSAPPHAPLLRIAAVGLPIDSQASNRKQQCINTTTSVAKCATGSYERTRRSRACRAVQRSAARDCRDCGTFTALHTSAASRTAAAVVVLWR
jgi:hypothetical protein